MLLKRSIILAAGVLLFIVAFIIYFDVSHAQMEDRFRAEREKFGVDHTILTASEPGTSMAAHSAAAPDTNALTSPVPPASPSAPDSTEAPASPAAPDTNSAPMPSAAPATPATPDPNSAPATPPPPSSTMDYPRAGHSPFLVLASYRPSEDLDVQIVSSRVGAATNSPAPVTSPATNTAAAATNATPAIATVPSPATNAAPATSSPVESVPMQPASGEASVIVLLYHQFRPAGVPIPPKFRWTMHQDVFESEMKYIHDNGYHVVPLSDVLRFIKHEITLPPGSVCITIDDGYKSAIDYAEPILKKYGYPWTFFIYPAFITVNEGSGAASWKDLLALQAEGVDIESHSMTHPLLSKKGGKTPEQYDAWLTNETAGAKALLEQKMGKTITCFAYPFGDYNKQVEAKVIAAGYEAILTVADNPVHSTTSLHSIGRYTITHEVEKNFPAYLRQSALSLAKADPEPGATISDPRPVITAVLAPMGADKIDPASIETQVRDYGVVKHDFDPQTNTLRLYLPRDLIQSVVLVNLRAKDGATGQIMVANWHFNYEPGPNAPHPPIAPAIHSPSASTKTPAPVSKPTGSVTTNAPATTEPEPMEKSAVGTPLDTHPAPPISSTPPAAPTPPASPPSTRD